MQVKSSRWCQHTHHPVRICAWMREDQQRVHFHHTRRQVLAACLWCIPGLSEWCLYLPPGSDSQQECCSSSHRSLKRINKAACMLYFCDGATSNARWRQAMPFFLLRKGKHLVTRKDPQHSKTHAPNKYIGTFKERRSEANLSSNRASSLVSSSIWHSWIYVQPTSD